MKAGMEAQNAFEGFTFANVHGGDKAGQWIVGGVPMRAV